MAPGLPRHVALLGMRGSGKTTVGCHLAKMLGAPFSDLDQLVLASLQRPSVVDAWIRYGERTWRQAEAHCLAIDLGGPPHVMSVGGGAPTFPDSLRQLADARLSNRAWIVHLVARLDVLAERIRATNDRPSITGADPVDELARVLDARLPVYESLADVTIDTSAGSPHDVAGIIVTRLGLNAARA